MFEFEDHPQNSALSYGPWLDLEGGKEAKIQLFQNMVMFHIKLKGMTHVATWLKLFCSWTMDTSSTQGMG